MRTPREIREVIDRMEGAVVVAVARGDMTTIAGLASMINVLQWVLGDPKGADFEALLQLCRNDDLQHKRHTVN